jgi:hypothetical protein
MFDWSTNRLFVLNTSWNLDSLQMIIFVHESSTCNVVELKTHFENLVTRNEFIGEYTFHLSYLITLLRWTLSLLVFPICTKCRNQVFYIWLFDLQYICAIYVLDTLRSSYDNIRIYLLDMQRSRIKNTIWNLITRKEVNGVYCFQFSYLITLWVLVILLTCDHNGHQLSKSNILWLIDRPSDGLC